MKHIPSHPSLVPAPAHRARRGPHPQRLGPLVLGLLALVAAHAALATAVASPLGASVTASADGEHALEAFVDELMREHFDRFDLVGASVTVVEGSDIVLSKGYGHADLATGAAVDPEATVFGTASVTKLFTWTAVMQLVERGQLDLDEDVNAYLTAFQIPDRFGEPVRLRHLLAHTAGFEDKPVAGLLSRTAGPDLEASLLRWMPARVWPPGLYTSYSNYGAALAGYIVAEVSGQPWDRYLESAILAPLGMRRTSGRQPIPGDLAEHLATAYHDGPDGPIETDHEYVPLSPAGGMVSTTADMARFMIAHLQHGAFGNTRILQEPTARQMHTQLFTHDARLPGNAHGFWEGDANGLRYLSHGGDTSSYTLLVLVPELDLGFYVAYNSPGGSQAREAFRKAFLDRIFPAPDAPASDGTPAAAGAFDDVVGTYGINRISTTTLTKLIGLGGALSVSSRDGYLVTEVSGLPPQRWVEEEPLSFTEVGGSDRLVFRVDDRGRVEQVYFGSFPMLAFAPIAWHDRSELHAALLGIALLALLSTFVAWPLYGRKARNAGGSASPIGARVARRLPAITGILYVAFFVALALFLLDPLEVEFGVPPILAVALTLGLVAGASTLATIVAAGLAWYRRSWSVVERTHYAIVALACVALTWQLHNWNLLGFRV